MSGDFSVRRSVIGLSCVALTTLGLATGPGRDLQAQEPVEPPLPAASMDLTVTSSGVSRPAQVEQFCEYGPLGQGACAIGEPVEPPPTLPTRSHGLLRLRAGNPAGAVTIRLFRKRPQAREKLQADQLDQSGLVWIVRLPRQVCWAGSAYIRVKYPYLVDGQPAAQVVDFQVRLHPRKPC